MSTLPPTPTTGFIGRPHDFAFLAGDWHIANRRLRQRHVGSQDWVEFAGSSRAWSLLDGIVSVDENDFPTQGFLGCSIRTLDLAQARWSIYWVASRDGLMTPPVYGGFDGDRGEFYGTDLDQGRTVLVRFTWLKTDPDAPRWEQAFSLDGLVWETNWVMAFTRIG